MSPEEVNQLIDNIADENIQRDYPEMITALKNYIAHLHEQLEVAKQSSVFAGMAEDWNDPSMDIYDDPPTPAESEI